MRSSVPFPPYKSCKDFMSMLLPETTLLGCTTTRDNWDRINEQVDAKVAALGMHGGPPGAAFVVGALQA